MKGKRTKGRQKKRWEDNIKERTGMNFASSTWAAENRTKLKGLVASSSVVLPRLWDITEMGSTALKASNLNAKKQLGVS